MRFLKTIAYAAGVVSLGACASQGTPPGGPVDTQAPKILRIAPDSGKTSVRPREVVFEFDEVVSERPSGAQSLDALFLISPRNGETQADWHRSAVSVHPRRGFKANTTYTINLLPGMTDLRGNARNTGATTVFSTGSSLATGKLSGTLFNWAEGRAIARGLVEARTTADTNTVYVTAADSVGDYVFRNLPPGSYRVRGFADDNSNRGLDPREAFDTVAITLADSAKADLLAFVHDSIGARLSAVNVRDSVTLELIFDNPLSPTNPLGVAGIRVRGSDSTDVGVLSVSGPPPDTTAALGRKPPKPAPFRTLTVRLRTPLRQKITYRVRVADVQNLIGVARTSEKEVVLPAPPPAPAVKPPDVPKK